MRVTQCIACNACNDHNARRLTNATRVTGTRRAMSAMATVRESIKAFSEAGNGLWGGARADSWQGRPGTARVATRRQ
eukprot:10086276-Lingulodinium_polyedra.AAC.1